MTLPMVDGRYGNWTVLDDEKDENFIAVVKDIDCFCEILNEATELRRVGKIHDKLNELLNYVEFAPVTIQKNGMVKWLGGEFVVQQ